MPRRRGGPSRPKMGVVNGWLRTQVSIGAKPQVSMRTKMAVVNESRITGVSVRRNRSQPPFRYVGRRGRCRRLHPGRREGDSPARSDTCGRKSARSCVLGSPHRQRTPCAPPRAAPPRQPAPRRAPSPRPPQRTPDRPQPRAPYASLPASNPNASSGDSQAMIRPTSSWS